MIVKILIKISTVKTAKNLTIINAVIKTRIFAITELYFYTVSVIEHANYYSLIQN